MDRLAGCAADGADGESLGRLFRRAVVACCHALLDDLDLAVEAGRAAFDQRDVGGQTHLVDVPPGIEVVEGVEDEGKAREPIDAELGVFDVGVVGDDLDRGVEFVGYFFGDLRVSATALDNLRDRTYQSFRLLDVFLSE